MLAVASPSVKDKKLMFTTAQKYNYLSGACEAVWTLLGALGGVASLLG